MKCILVFLMMLLSVFTMAEVLLVYQGFGYILGSADPQSNSFLIELPKGAWVEPSSIIVSGVPEGTRTSYIPEDDLKSLLRRNVGKEVIWYFANGDSQRMQLIDPTPVLRDSEGNLYFSPQGYPVFVDSSYKGNASLLVEMPEDPLDEIEYSFRVDGATWTTRYAFRWIDDYLHVTGNIVVNLSFSPGERQVMLVAANLGTGKAVTRSFAAVEFDTAPDITTADMRIYKIERSLTEGTNLLAYVSRFVDAEKRYVLRGGSMSSAYAGLDVDILIDELPVDLAAGSVEIWDEGFLSGIASIENLVKGDSVRLSGVARAIELQGRKTTVLDTSDPGAFKYTTHYWVKNLSEDKHEVVIDDSLPRGAFNVRVHVSGMEQVYEAPSDTPDRLILDLLVDKEDVKEVRVTYSVRR